MTSPTPPARTAPSAPPPGDTGGGSTERIQQLLARITDLSDAELTELRDLILQRFDASQADPSKVHSTDDFEELAVLASAAQTVRLERERRDELAAQAHENLQVLSSFRQSRPGAVVPGDRRPRRVAAGSGARALTASGAELPDRDAFVQEFVSALSSLRGSRGPDGEKVKIATLHADRGPERTLRSSDSPEAVTAALAAAAEAHTARTAQAITAAAKGEPAAITAAGGPGAIPDVDYALPGYEVVDRPVKAALPGFTTDRAGVRFVLPPTLADLTGSVGVWTMQNDIDAATNTAIRKPSIRVTPAGEVLVNVEAITSSLVFGNLLNRAYPEWVTRVTELALAYHARVAEQQLLTQLGALSTSVSGAADEGNNLGATRVLLPLLDRAAVAMRNRLRMGKDVPLQLILPEWSEGILRSDLALQEPGDSTVGVTDAELLSYFAARQLAVTWALDGEAGQQFDVQNPGAVNDWPTEIVSYMFPAGAFQFLDGGTLDLGIVRDTTMTAANDFMVFSETFEAALFRGGEAFRLSQAVTPSGVARAAEAAAA